MSGRMKTLAEGKPNAFSISHFPFSIFHWNRRKTRGRGVAKTPRKDPCFLNSFLRLGRFVSRCFWGQYQWKMEDEKGEMESVFVLMAESRVRLRQVAERLRLIYNPRFAGKGKYLDA
jgi:hypothetical protein